MRIDPSAERGQASVELVAVLPLLALVAAFAWQAVVAGQGVWLAGTAARAGARAQALGQDAAAGARAALPPAYRGRIRVRASPDGRVAVRLAIPLTAAGGGRTLTTVAREARFVPQGR